MISAFCFPGQGAQFVGMGREFYKASPEARAIFDQAEKAVGEGFREVIFEGPAEQLTSTAFCQPAILTFSVAALKALQAHPRGQTIQPRFTAGLSLGEYSALVASGALDFTETIKLVQKRAMFMEQATKIHQGGMAAIIGLEVEKIKEICAQTGAEVANYNTPMQTVITGLTTKVQEACQACRDAGAKSVVPLEVSGGFHSSLMKTAADAFRTVLQDVRFQPTKVPLISNVDARPAVDPEKIRANLAQQITSSVQWVDTIQWMAHQGVTTFFEIGPGTVLKGLIKKISRDFNVINVQIPADLENLPV